MIGVRLMSAACVGGALMISSASAATATAGQEIARSNACMGCHAIDGKRIGPSFHQIADKYKGDATAPAKLVLKVKNGGSGVWGAVPMLSHPTMSQGDLQTVVEWVLAGAPEK
jgi:cytochrome c